MKYLFSMPLLAAFLFAAPAAAQEGGLMSKALAHACDMMRAGDESADRLARTFDAQATMFKQGDRSGISNRIRTELKNFNFVRSGIYDVGGLDGFLREYLVALGADNYRNVYLLLRYETVRETEVKLTNFAYFDNFSRIEPQKLMRAPARLDCSAG